MSPTAPPLDERWNLADLFESPEAFEKSKREFGEKLLPPIDRFRDRLLSSAALLADALDAAYEARRQLHCLLCHASLKSDEDTRIAADQARRLEAQLLATELSKCIAYLRPEILAGDSRMLEGFLAEEPRLEPYRHFLQDLLRQRAHVLQPGEERILAESGLIRGQASSTYQLLSHTELPRPEVQLDDGRSVRLTSVAFQKHRTTRHRPDRQKMFPAYFSAYSAFRDTFGHNLYAGVKEHLFVARTRGYPSCLAAALDPDNVPVGVYHTLIRQVREALPLLHRYFKLRAGCLGLERLEYPDLYCPLSEGASREYSTAQAGELVRGSLASLGESYGTPLADAFRSRWIDWHPADGKRSGAYATGWAYDVHPYVLLNFNGDYESVSTLAHEMGHAMHSHFSNETQPFCTADYSIFVAEVASTFNEALLLQSVLETATSAPEQLFILGSYLDGIRGTLFRQAMFAEFELEIHQRVERSEVLTGETLDGIYLQLLREYHGHDQGVCHIADEYAIEWAAIPHMYYDFYVYQYATGIVAAGALSSAVLGAEPGARERYLAFLRSGGSDYPLALLRNAGIDLEQPAPYRQTFAAIEARLNQLEELVGSGAGTATR